MWYLCGLGSNIEPQHNLARAVERLLDAYGALWLSPVIHTRPRGIDTERSFLNALAVLFSPLSPQQLKCELNLLEESFGRDRSDPLSSRKDRTLDVDILEYSKSGRFAGSDIDEPYYRDLFDGRNDGSVRVSLDVAAHTLGQAPATIHRNLGAGDEIVVHQGQQLENHTVKAPFAGQQGF